jgi:NADH oxidase (H2O2-forming)
MSNRIVIVGCGAAGWSAALAARKTDRESRITVIEQGRHPMYERGGIPYVIQGDIPGFDDLIHFPVKYYGMMHIDLRTETEVVELDSSARVVTVANNSGTEKQVPYDSLIIATGAAPNIVPIPGHGLPGVYGVRTLEDGREIHEKCKTAKSAVVVGARLVGLEMAVALRERGLRVTVVEFLPQILDGVLDPELAKEVQQELESKEIGFVLGTGVSGILGEDHVKAVQAGPHKFNADLVIMATGVRARTQLAQQIGAELGTTRLIKVNNRMETSIGGVFAAGDCVQCVNTITNKPVISQLGTNAIRQGKVAGTNAAGGSMTYPTILGACITRLFDSEVASTGLTESYAQKGGIDCVSASVRVPARALCYPDEFQVRLKLVADRNDGRLIGAQVISQKEVSPRIDAMSLAIMKAASAEDLVLFDHAYSPPVADSTDAFSAAAEILCRKRQKGQKSGLQSQGDHAH